MAITFVAAGAGVGNTGSINPDLPAGIDVHDILVLVCESAGTEVVSTPTDWSILDQAYETGNASTGTRLSVFWKRVVGGETSPTVSDPGDHVVGRIAAYRGCRQAGNPWNAVVGGVDATAGTSVSITGVTTTVDDCRILNIICSPFDTSVSNQVSGWSNGSLSGIAERFDNFTTNGNGGGVGMIDSLKATAGATGSTSVTLANSAVTAFMTVALEPQLLAVNQVGVATSGTSSDGSDVSVAKPSGVESGDVLIAFGCTTETTPYFDTIPAGFTEFATNSDGDTPSFFRASAWYKVCGGSEPSSYTFGSGGAESAVTPITVVMAAWRGVDTGAPVPQVSEAAGGSSSEPANPGTSFSQASVGRMFFMRASRSTTAIPTFSTTTPGWSELADAGDFSGGSIRYGISLFARDIDTSSGTQTEPAVTCSTTDTDNVYILGVLQGLEQGIDVSSGTTAAAVSVSAPTSGVGAKAEVIG